MKFKNGIPIYMQIISHMKISIANGKYPPGSKVPTVRDMAMEAGVNPNTVQRAFTELERDGLLFTDRTNGRFVTEDKELLISLKKNMSETFIRELFEKLTQIGMSRKEIIDSVSAWNDENIERN